MKISRCLVIGLAVFASQTLAQEATPEKESLAGPRVAEKPAKQTLVHRDFNGELVPLDSTPEEAAIEMLKLSPDERTAAEAVLLERSRGIDAVVADNIPLLLRLQGVKEE